MERLSESSPSMLARTVVFAVNCISVFADCLDKAGNPLR